MSHHILPPSIEKALSCEGRFVLRVRTGEVVLFSAAELEAHGTFLKITLDDATPAERLMPWIRQATPNGVSVRIDDIVWCAELEDGHSG